VRCGACPINTAVALLIFSEPGRTTGSRVKVSAPHDKAPKGETWELDLEAFLAASETERKRLADKGYVKKVTQYSGAYYGGVTVELF
jgi:hypothetical protein